jgi:hypothetical protein
MASMISCLLQGITVIPSALVMASRSSGGRSSTSYAAQQPAQVFGVAAGGVTLALGVGDQAEHRILLRPGLLLEELLRPLLLLRFGVLLPAPQDGCGVVELRALARGQRLTPRRDALEPAGVGGWCRFSTTIIASSRLFGSGNG